MRIVLLLFAIGLATSMAVAEDLRCENNRQRMAELRREYVPIERRIPFNGQTAADVRKLAEHDRRYLQTAIADLRRGRIAKDTQVVKNRVELAEAWHLAWKDEWWEDLAGYFQALLAHLNQVIADLDRPQKIEQELSFHEQRLKELNCDQIPSVPKVEPLPGDAEAPKVPARLPAKVAGGLVLAKTDVTPPHDEVGGVGNLRGHYTNTPTSASFDFTATTSEGKFVRHVQTRFDIAIISSGNSYVLQPGDMLTITVTGTEARTPAMDHDAPPGGFTLDVYSSGLEKISSTSCHVGSGFSDGYHANCRSESTFKVPAGAEKVTISFSGTGAMGTAVTYIWEKPR